MKQKRIEGISQLRDESDKDGMRIAIELKRGELNEVVLNNLYAQTAMQSVFGINMVALVDRQPRILNLKQILEAFIRHRREIVTRRTVFELRKASERAHILEGWGIAFANIDAMVALIKASNSPAIARENLTVRAWPAGMVAQLLQEAGDIIKLEEMDDACGLKETGYYLSVEQAQAILELRLHRLTGLEQEKIINEYRDILVKIKDYLEILSNPDRLLQVICDELQAIREQFGDERRTVILDSQHDLTVEDLIPEEDVVVTLSHHGYAKSQALSVYQAQRRGGKGKMATRVKDEDFVEKLLVTHSHDTLLCFSSIGKLYWLKAYQFPQGERTTRGKPIVNLLPLQPNERITAITAVSAFVPEKFVFMATANGTVKKVALSHFSRPRTNGIIALDLVEGDELVGVDITDGNHHIMLLTSAGKAIRFHETEIRPTGRSSRGVRGVRLIEDQRVISLVLVEPEGMILTATEQGYGKRTNNTEYRPIARGGMGVISIQTSERNGNVIGAIQVFPGDEVMLISNKGTLVRTRVDEISLVGRNAQGVRLINLVKDELLVGIQRIEECDIPKDEENTSEYLDEEAGL